MGELKKANDVSIKHGGGCVKGFLILFSAVSVIFTFGLVNYLQFYEILNLKQQIGELSTLQTQLTYLQNKLGTQVHNVEVSSQNRRKRDVPTDSLTGFVTALVQQEIKVLESYCGNASKICLPGPQGLSGLKGDQGVQGVSGSSGPPGPKGQQGSYGVPGIPGFQGDKGDKGDTGDKGENGHYGDPGVPGVKGEEGHYGVPGLPGVKGDPGAMGLSGAKGDKGDEGRPLPFNQQCCSTLSKPKFQGNKTETVTAYVGNNVVLPCQSSGYPPPTITFMPVNDPLAKNRYSVSGAGLEISRAEITDGGQFKCTIDNIFGTTEKIIDLIITDPVVATTTPSSVNINVGSSIRIDCDVSGTPIPTVTWQHRRPDGQIVPVLTATLVSNGRSTLQIASAQPNDAGSYTCSASNQYETDQAITMVNVVGKPQIINPPKTQFVLEGSTVTLYCATVANPPAQVTWAYPLTGANAPLNAHLNLDNSITLTAVDTYNSGDYTCTATNSAGTVSASATVNVDTNVVVTAIPHVKSITGSEPVLNFQCSATGNPPPTVTWSKEGSALSGNSKYLILTGGNLIITSVDINTDTGVYDCFGQSRNGNATDKTIVYKDLGQLDCTMTFQSVACGTTITCGGTCPGSCINTGNNLYGYQTYPMESPICLAAVHTGSLPNKDNLVLWHHQASSPASYPSQTHNGLTSQTHIATQDSNMVILPTSTSRTQGAGTLIG